MTTQPNDQEIQTLKELNAYYRAHVKLRAEEYQREQQASGKAAESIPSFWFDEARGIPTEDGLAYIAQHRTPLPKLADGLTIGDIIRKGWAPDPKAKISLVGADLSGVDLSGLDLSKANFCCSRLTRANLASASFLHADLRNVGLDHANLDGTSFAAALIEGTDWTCAKNCRNACFVSVTLETPEVMMIASQQPVESTLIIAVPQAINLANQLPHDARLAYGIQLADALEKQGKDIDARGQRRDLHSNHIGSGLHARSLLRAIQADDPALAKRLSQFAEFAEFTLDSWSKLRQSGSPIVAAPAAPRVPMEGPKELGGSGRSEGIG